MECGWQGAGGGVKLINSMEKNTVVCLPHREHSTESRWTQVLNLKSRTIKLREEIVGESGLDVGKHF